MSILDAQKLQGANVWTADVCIVGAGAAGIYLSNQLARAGHSVLLVESGGFRFDKHVQSLYDLVSIGHPQREAYLSRLRYFGGTCNIWGGRCMRLQPIDFSERSWVPWSGWPVSEAELDPYYTNACDELALPGVNFTDFTSCPIQISERDKILMDQERLAPIIALLSNKARRFGKAYRKIFTTSDRVKTILNLNVVNINLDKYRSSVQSVTARTTSGKSFRIHARAFILACGGLETPRILLNSRDKQPAGVGNDYGLVGRFYMDHPRAVYGRVQLEPGYLASLATRYPVHGGRVHFGMQAEPALQRELGMLNHYLFLERRVSARAAHFYPHAIQLGKALLKYYDISSVFHITKAQARDLVYLLPPGDILPGQIAKAVTKAIAGRNRSKDAQEFLVVYNCEQPPDPESRVSIAQETDVLGMNRLVLDWKINRGVVDSVIGLQQVLSEALVTHGAGRLVPDEGEPSFSDASHHMGTTRMSASPRRGVVNADCKVHGLHNLYIAGSSVFPAAGHANPTLTILALAERLAVHVNVALRRPQEAIETGARRVA